MRLLGRDRTLGRKKVESPARLRKQEVPDGREVMSHARIWSNINGFI